MGLVLIRVPYHLGREEGGLVDGVTALGDALADEADGDVAVERSGEFFNEIVASMDVVRVLSDRVREVVAGDGFPLVLAANCGSSLGTVAGLGTPSDLGAVWFDAHADFNTPETTTTGFFDGMPLAMLTGSGWAGLRATVPGLGAVPEENVVLVGARDVDDAERERIAHSKVTLVHDEPLEPALDALRARVPAVYLHLDLDVLDPSFARANWWAVEGGLGAQEFEAAVDAVASRFEIRAAAFTAYAPDCDPDGAIPPLARAVTRRLAAALDRAGVT